MDTGCLSERNLSWHKFGIVVESPLFYRVSRPEIELFAVQVTSDSNNSCPIPVSLKIPVIAALPL